MKVPNLVQYLNPSILLLPLSHSGRHMAGLLAFKGLHTVLSTFPMALAGPPVFLCDFYTGVSDLELVKG